MVVDLKLNSFDCSSDQNFDFIFTITSYNIHTQ